jgi:RNA 2',3'-cyclic 3'-phosphodiesterase
MDEARPRKRRLFVGITLDAASRAACVAVSEELRTTGLRAKYEAAEKLHATLAFLGFVDPRRVDEIVAALGQCASGSIPFAITLDKVGAFPHERRPRIVYVGAREQGAAFRSLAANVRAAYAALGFEFNNDPVAHVTLARIKEFTRALPLIDVAPIRLPIESLTLFESLPDPANKTSRYEVASCVTLSPPRDL